MDVRVGFLAILFMSWRHRLAPMRGASICCAAGCASWFN
jgi:hypothetical protein